jgi:hypothetical protein
MIPAKPHAFPTRLIDVGPPDGSKEPYLFETFGQRGSYATLSRCWGTSPAFTTTKSNMDDMKKSIPWVKIPKCFQNAILVLRGLNI